MCSLEHTYDHDSDSDKTRISSSARSHPESFGIVRNRLESFEVVWSRSESESIGVVYSRSESTGNGVGHSQQEPSGAMGFWSGISFRCVFFIYFTLRMHFVDTGLCVEGRFRTTPNDSTRLRATPHDCGRLQTIPTSTDSGRLRAFPDDSERLRIMLGGPTFRSRIRNYRRRIGVDSGLLPTWPMTRVDHFIS